MWDEQPPFRRRATPLKGNPAVRPSRSRVSREDRSYFSIQLQGARLCDGNSEIMGVNNVVVSSFRPSSV